MLEARKKKQSESLFCKKKFSSLEFLLYLWRREHLTQGGVFDIGPCFQSTGRLMTPLSQLRKLCPVVPGPAASGVGWWSCWGWASTWVPSLAGACDTSSLLQSGVPMYHPLSASPLSSLFADSPSSGDDEDDDDESEDTGNLFFWDTEAFPLRQLWLPSSAAHLGVHTVVQQLSLCAEIGDLRMEPWGNLSKNLETAARVVLLLCFKAAQQQYCFLKTSCWESE